MFPDNTVQNVLYDFRNAKSDVTYTNPTGGESKILNMKASVIALTPTTYKNVEITLQNYNTNTAIPDQITAPIVGMANYDNLALYLYRGPNETETDDPATHTVLFPPPETDAEWVARIEPRITNLSRCYADGIPGQHSRFDALEQRVSSADEVGQLNIGFVRWQFEKHANGETGKDNGVYTTKAEVEGFIQQLEDRFPDKDEVTKFYYRHPRTKWAAASTRGQIFIPNEDHDHGDKIHDTFNAHLTGNPPRTTTRGKPTPEIQQATEKSERDIRAIKTALRMLHSLRAMN